MPSELPALLISQNAKRKNAKKSVKEAIQTIKAFAALAGISDRSLFEFIALSKFMETELIREKFPNK